MTLIGPPTLTDNYQIDEIDDQFRALVAWLTAALLRDDSGRTILPANPIQIGGSGDEAPGWIGSAFTEPNGFIRLYYGSGIYWDPPSGIWRNNRYGGSNGWTILSGHDDGTLRIYAGGNSGNLNRTFTAAEIQTFLRQSFGVRTTFAGTGTFPSVNIVDASDAFLSLRANNAPTNRRQTRWRNQGGVLRAELLNDAYDTILRTLIQFDLSNGETTLHKPVLLRPDEAGAAFIAGNGINVNYGAIDLRDALGSGDGTLMVNGKVIDLLGDPVTALPASPRNGQVANLLVDTAGTYGGPFLWRCTYVAGDPGPHKWHVNGPPLIAFNAASVATNPSTFQLLAPTIAVPFSGQYEARVTAGLYNDNNSPGGAYTYLAAAFASSVVSDEDAAVVKGGDDVVVTSPTIRRPIAAGLLIRPAVRNRPNGPTGEAHSYYRTVVATPVKISA